MNDKTEATRLADALDAYGETTQAESNLRAKVSALLRRWPDGGKAEFAFQCALDAPTYPHFPSWANVAVMSRDYWAKIRGRNVALEEDSAIQRERFHMMRDRADYLETRNLTLEAALEQARVALEELLHHNGAGSQERGQAALNAIEEAQR